MNDKVVDILEQAKEDIQRRMAEESINATGRSSASWRVEQYPNGVRLVYGNADTAPLPSLEVGISPEEAPTDMRTFMAALIDWSRAKGIQFPTEGRRRSFSYLLGRRIQREGTLRHMKPVDVYTTIVMDTAQQVTGAVKVTVTQYIHQQLRKQ